MTINDCISGITAATINSICIGLWIIFMAEIWKWFFGVMKRGLLNLFPALKTLGRKPPKKKKDDRDLVP